MFSVESWMAWDLYTIMHFNFYFLRGIIGWVALQKESLEICTHSFILFSLILGFLRQPPNSPTLPHQAPAQPAGPFYFQALV